MSKDDYEHRRHFRYGVRAVSGHLTLPLEVRVTNMSLTGLAVETPLPLEIGGRHTLTLRHGEDLIQLATVVMWCRPVQPEGLLLGEAPPSYEAGLDFRPELDEKARELLGFLQHSIVIEVGRGVAGRFEIVGGAVGSCRIRELSFAETLIETGTRPEVGDVCAIELRVAHLELEIRGEVREARRLPDSQEPVWEVRIAFGELSPETQEALEEMVTCFLE